MKDDGANKAANLAQADRPPYSGNAETASSDLNALRLHIVSEHCNGAGLTLSLEDALEYHGNEHRGPCTIRNHDPQSLHWDERSVIEVLSEVAEADGLASIIYSVLKGSGSYQSGYRSGVEDAAKIADAKEAEYRTESIKAEAVPSAFPNFWAARARAASGIADGVRALLVDGQNERSK